MSDPQTRVERHPPALPGATDGLSVAGPAAGGTRGAAAAGPHTSGPAVSGEGAAGPGTCPRCGGHRDAPSLETCWLCFRRAQAVHARAAHDEQAAGRREDYTWLRGDQHLTIGQAAERLGVTYRTAQRYEAWRRKAAAA